MATVLITGGTGMIGKALTRALLEKNYKVIILSRDPANEIDSTFPGNVAYGAWNIDDNYLDPQAITKADYIVHLAGAGIADKRWTAKRKQEIRDSRVKTGQLIVKTLEEVPNKVKAVVSASAIGWYGPDPQIPNPQPFMEDDPYHNGFLGSTCKEWEESLDPISSTGRRLIKLRTGIVLSNDGGALEEFEKPLKFGVAAILGSGRQRISWIHIDDLVRLYINAIESDDMRGVFNAVAPKPVSNKEFTLRLANAKRGKFFIPVHVPAFVLKVKLGELSIEVLKSATVSCDKIHYSGFTFLYPSIDAAFQNLYEPANTR